MMDQKILPKVVWQQCLGRSNGNISKHKFRKSLKEPKEVTRVPGKVGSVLPRYSKVNKDEIVGYVLDMKMPKARGKSKKDDL